MQATLMRHLRRNVVAYLALFVALGGTSFAAATVITGKNVKNSSLTGADVKNSSLTGTDVKNNSLGGSDIGTGAVNSDDVANGSLLALDFASGQLPAGPQGPKGDTGPPGDPGQPPPVEGQTTVSTLGAGWSLYAATPVRYFKDPAGVVHLQGGIQAGTPGRTTPLFTLPVGYRPAETFLEFAPLSTSAGDTPASSMVEICGTINCGGPDGSPDPGSVYVVQSGGFYQSLDGISFRAGG